MATPRPLLLLRTQKSDVSLFHLSDRKSRIGLLQIFVLIMLSLVKIVYLHILAFKICLYLFPTPSVDTGDGSYTDFS
jgi:hypothetical protein